MLRGMAMGGCGSPLFWRAALLVKGSIRRSLEAGATASLCIARAMSAVARFPWGCAAMHCCGEAGLWGQFHLCEAGWNPGNPIGSLLSSCWAALAFPSHLLPSILDSPHREYESVQEALEEDLEAVAVEAASTIEFPIGALLMRLGLGLAQQRCTPAWGRGLGRSASRHARQQERRCSGLAGLWALGALATVGAGRRHATRHPCPPSLLALQSAPSWLTSCSRRAAASRARRQLCRPVWGGQSGGWGTGRGGTGGAQPQGASSLNLQPGHRPSAAKALMVLCLLWQRLGRAR